MLRVSAKVTNSEVDIQGINGDVSNGDLGIKFGVELVAFAQTIATRDNAGIAKSRDILANTAGPNVVVDAAGVAANFQRMVRIADAIGIPVDDMTAEISLEAQRDLNLTRFASAQNTLGQLN